jgi:hypothetical protein
MSVDYEVSARENRLLQQFANAKILNPVPGLCPNKICVLVEDGAELYRDSWHLSEYGSLKLSALIRTILAEMTRE